MALEDYDRVRAIFELAVDQELLDMPELLWKAYIDFEEESGEFDRVRGLFERLLEKTDHVKVWISYAHFEVNADEGEDEDTVSEETKARARKIFERAYKRLKEKELKEEVCSPLPHKLAVTNEIYVARRTPQRLESVRANARHPRRPEEGGSADAQQGQEAEKAGRRYLRGVHGVHVPRRRAVQRPDPEYVTSCSRLEAESGGLRPFLRIMSTFTLFLSFLLRGGGGFFRETKSFNPQ